MPAISWRYCCGCGRPRQNTSMRAHPPEATNRHSNHVNKRTPTPSPGFIRFSTSRAYSIRRVKASAPVSPANQERRCVHQQDRKWSIGLTSVPPAKHFSFLQIIGSGKNGAMPQRQAGDDDDRPRNWSREGWQEIPIGVWLGIMLPASKVWRL